ncbi:MAG TPA: serine/threonine-protein kinase [Labilithrix sp.]|nr:serine/threonine-protein kinase [Labilithrix sp.]
MPCPHPSSADLLTLGDGRILSLAEPIGRGSLGEVHRAVLESGCGLRRPVAVKIIDATSDGDQDELLKRLARTARRAACVGHPAVIQTLEVDRTEHRGAARSFVVMELVSGESLASLLHTWREEGLRVPVDFALVVALKVAEGLGAALFSDDASGGVTNLLHGDLSPRQVLVSDGGDVKVGDFGQGALRDVVSHVRSRYAIGYTAPEVACGHEGDARSDVFSLGVMLHEMLVGPRFAPRTSTVDVIEMVQAGELHLGVMVPNLPRELRAVLDRALAPHANERYPHARAFAFDLRREMLKMGLCDTQTCIRQAVVGWCDLRGSSENPALRKSDVVPRSSEDTSPEIRRAKLR